MKDEEKTREQLLNEMAEMRQRVAERKTPMSPMNRNYDFIGQAKELCCLYGISKLLEKPDISLGEILLGIVGLIPQPGSIRKLPVLE